MQLLGAFLIMLFQPFMVGAFLALGSSKLAHLSTHMSSRIGNAAQSMNHRTCLFASTTSSMESPSSLITDRLLDECSGMGNASGGIVKTMRWNAATRSFKIMFQSQNDSKRIKKRTLFAQALWEIFMPSGELTSDYYTYTAWRLAQRFVGASSSVFGTQALVLALGFKSNSIGIAAATRWVLKDALGKFSRIFWASLHGRKFDFNAKKWRFRSALLFATGNGFEILTYIFPSLFLVLAAIANAAKQMAMLTSSATRNAIYKSFSRKSDNIGDITAKGEAQIAVVDLMGMVVGILLARLVSGDRYRMVVSFTVMSALDIFCLHKEIRSVIFNSLNYERTGLVLHGFFCGNGAVASPITVAENEQLLLSCSVSESVFTTWSRLPRQVSPSHLQTSFDLFGPNNKFCVVMYREGSRLVPSVLLRKEATAADIFRALLVVHRALYLAGLDRKDSSGSTSDRNDESSEASINGVLAEAASYEQENLPTILQQLGQGGWDTSKFVYGAVSDRVIW